MNHQHKVNLVEAEKCRVLGKNYEAGDLYDQAIRSAKENGFIQEQALANELAAKFYLDWGKELVAAGYMQQAYYCYTKWGAKAKIAHLEKYYPQLLTPILQPSKLTTANEETITSNVTLVAGCTNTITSQNLLLFSCVSIPNQGTKFIIQIPITL